MASSHCSRFFLLSRILVLTYSQIAGPKLSTVPQAGLDTTARNGPLAQLIVKQIVDNNADPDGRLLYNPAGWTGADNMFFPADYNWLQPPVVKIINGRRDAFSQR